LTKQGVQVELDFPKRNPPKRIVLTLPESRSLVGSLAGITEPLTAGDDIRP